MLFKSTIFPDLKDKYIGRWSMNREPCYFISAYLFLELLYIVLLIHFILTLLYSISISLGVRCYIELIYNWLVVSIIWSCQFCVVSHLHILIVAAGSFHASFESWLFDYWSYYFCHFHYFDISSSGRAFINSISSILFSHARFFLFLYDSGLISVISDFFLIHSFAFLLHIFWFHYSAHFSHLFVGFFCWIL